MKIDPKDVKKKKTSDPKVSEDAANDVDSNLYKVGSLDCFQGGASSPAEGQAFVTNVGVEKCKELCGKSTSCHAFMVGHGNCWLRKDVHLSSCMPSGDMELWGSVEKLLGPFQVILGLRLRLKKKK